MAFVFIVLCALVILRAPAALSIQNTGFSNTAPTLSCIKSKELFKLAKRRVAEISKTRPASAKVVQLLLNRTKSDSQGCFKVNQLDAIANALFKATGGNSNPVSAPDSLPKLPSYFTSLGLNYATPNVPEYELFSNGIEFYVTVRIKPPYILPSDGIDGFGVVWSGLYDNHMGAESFVPLQAGVSEYRLPILLGDGISHMKVGGKYYIGIYAAKGNTLVNSLTDGPSQPFSVTISGDQPNYSPSCQTASKDQNLQAPSFTLSSYSELVAVNTASTGFTSTSTGGLVDCYSITPSIPSGMSFNVLKGQLSGIPTTLSGTTTYTITARNAAGYSSQNFVLSVLDAKYSVGDRGPGGGTVYFVYPYGFSCGSQINDPDIPSPTGSPSHGLCHYLEVAPLNWNIDPRNGTGAPGFNPNPTLGDPLEAGGSRWGSDSLPHWNLDRTFNSQGLGYGLVSRSPGAAAAYRGGNKSDWTVPDITELNLLCQWAHGVAVSLSTPCGSGPIINGGFNTSDGWYWSSSYTGEDARGDGRELSLNFYQGLIQEFSVFGEAYVRAIREF